MTQLTFSVRQTVERSVDDIVDALMLECGVDLESDVWDDVADELIADVEESITAILEART